MRSKEALDKIINKSRVHLYKPIQLAEILYHYRNGAKIKLDDVESYRNISKKWRDEITKRLVGEFLHLLKDFKIIYLKIMLCRLLY